MKARQEMHRYDSSGTIMKFDKYESHIERMEAEAEMTGSLKDMSLEKKFDTIIADDDIEKELQDLKDSNTTKEKK